MAATQAETQQNDANSERVPPDQHSDSRNTPLQNGTDKNVNRAMSGDGGVNTKAKSPMAGEPGQFRGDADPGPERGPQDPHYQYRGYPEGDMYGYGPRPGFPGKVPRSPHGAQPQRFLSGQSISQPTGPTPTLNSLLQSGGGPPLRYPNSYEQPPAPYQGWGPHPPPPRPMAPYSPQPYRNPSPSGGSRVGGAPYGGPGGGGYPGGPPPPPPGPPQGSPQPYSPYPPHQRYPAQGPPPRPPYSPHQMDQGPSPQPSPGGAPSSPGHAPSASPQPPHSPHQPYPPRPGQPSTPNAHDPESELTGQNSNDSSSGGGGGGSREGLLRPSPSPTGSTGSRSMSPAVGQQNIPMPPRPSSSSQSEGGGGAGVRAAPAVPAPAPAAGPPQQGVQPPYPPPQPPYKMPPHHQPYPPPQHQYPQGNYSPRPPYPNAGYGGAGAGASQYGAPGRPPAPGPPPPSQQPYPGTGGGYPGPGAAWGARAPPPPPPHYLKQHLQQRMGPPPPQPHVMGPPGEPAQQDNGPPATALVTTGPDGAPLDDGSQQSTLSNASAASGEEGGSSGGGGRSGGRGGPGGAPSPGAASHAGAHDDYEPSPSAWPRTPSSPVFNSHVPQENYRTKQKSDSLGKLYEMDTCPERRGWVERLLAFMEERRTPIAACPTISKQPLDLYRLYLHVRERGGFVEVTKNKTWKDIAGLLGIGASSSAAYTLRKHYTKNLLAYECHFDRGGIDPQPIINQVEATTKKKASKNNSVPSPGSSNSQDSFPGGGGPPPPGGPPCETYGPPYSPYPPAAQAQQGGGGGPPGDNMAASNPFEDPQPRRNHQSGGGYPGQQGYGYDQYGSAYPANRPVYPPYGPEQDSRGYPAGGGDPYRYGSGYGGSPGGARGYVPPGGPPAAPPGPGGPPAPPQSPTPPPPAQGGAAPPQDYYRSPQQQHEMSPVNMNSQLARQLVAPLSPGGPRQYHGYGSNKAMGPPAGQPRRHPDFAKDPPGPQPPYPPQRGAAPPPHHQYGGWGNNSGGPQYRGQFPSGTGAAGAGAPPPGPGQWGAGPPRAPVPPPAPPSTPPSQQPWGPQPYPPQQQGQQPGGWGPGAGLRPPGQPGPPRPPAPYRPDLKPYPMQPQTPGKGGVGVTPKREITFPPDSVEAVTPVTYKRRRLTKADVAPVDAWKIMMALKSGLLAETCWALDVLNILLFDDSAVGYFGLQHLPGLLDLLLQHFQKSLTDIFDPPATESTPWYMPDEPERPTESGPVPRVCDPSQSVALVRCDNFTHESRKGKPVIYKAREDDLFAPDEGVDWGSGEEHAEGGEPWQFGSDIASVNHVMPCFQGEFINIPFVRILQGPERPVKKEEKRESDSEAAEPAVKETQGVVSKKSNCVSEKFKKRTKATLLDVINRINGDNKINGEEETIKEEVREEPIPVEEVRQNGPTEETGELCDKESAESEDNFKSEPMEIEKDEKPVEKKHNLKVNDPAGTLKRRHLSEYEDECYTRDEASLYLVSETQDALARRCICLSNILRNLTFVPGNETEFSKSGTFLALMGKLLLLHHEHPLRAPRTRNYDREEDAEWRSSCSSLRGGEWWWELLQQLREDALVCCANIGGQVELGRHPEQVARPVLDGLLHWAVCPAAAAQDPLPAAPLRPLSPRRLALEALCKLCVTDSNVDLVVATPPFPRLERLCRVLARHLCRSEDQVLREFSVNLLHYLAGADSAVARTIAAHSPAVSLLVAFIEQAEQSALGVANQHGIGALRDNPDSMGTSLDMLRRAASTLLQLARHPDNKPLFLQQEQRLLSLVMSQILDQKVAAELSKVLFQCSRHPRR